jgi:hypothetical protein
VLAAILATCSSTKVRSHTQRRINRNDGRSVRNSNRSRAAQLSRPKGLRDGSLPSFASSMIFWATASRNPSGSARGTDQSRSLDWLKFKNPAAPAVRREAEEDWGKAR